MKQIALQLAESGLKVGAVAVLGRIFKTEQPEALQAKYEAAEEELKRRQLEATASLVDSLRQQDAAENAEGAENREGDKAEAVAVAGVGITAPSATSSMQVCPACLLFDEVALARSYAENIVRNCGTSGEIPKGYGGTIVQVRSHLTAAMSAARRVGAERPQYAGAVDLMAMGLQGLLQSLEGEGVGCATVQRTATALLDAERAADKLAQAWFRKPQSGQNGQNGQALSREVPGNPGNPGNPGSPDSPGG